MQNDTATKENSLAAYKKLNMNLSYNPDISLQDIYPKEKKNMFTWIPALKYL